MPLLSEHMTHPEKSTIAAVSTPAGFGGIGIIKVSGPEALAAASEIFRPGSKAGGPQNFAIPPDQFSSWRMHYGWVIDPDSGRHLDEVVLAVMRGPASYTREDVVEIQAHAGPAALKAIMELLTRRGIRLAEPGEFTRRAFINGRIDLTQAEAVIDMINARSEAARQMASAQMSGGLGLAVAEIRSTITDALAEMEALVDFPEAVEDEIDAQRLRQRLTVSVRHPIEALMARHESQDLLRSGLRVVIAGGPNVGKSSLMNRLISEDRAIVTDQPGTTRDVIEAAFLARGVPITLADTAGIRSDPGPIERIGIEKARKQVEAADLVLLVIDVSQPLRDEDVRFFKTLAKPTVLLLNKIDLPKSEHRFRLPVDWEPVRQMEISALFDIGIDEVRQAMAEVADTVAGDATDRVVPNLRHQALLLQSLESVSAALAGIDSGAPPELLAIDLRAALDALGEITGDTVAPDVLDRIFSQYCIGK